MHQRIQAYQVRMLSGRSVDEVEDDPCILSLSADGKIFIAADPMRSQQLYMDVIDHTHGAKVLFESSMAIQKPVVMGIVDTGIDGAHPDLAGQLWTGPNGSFGYDFVSEDFSPLDDNGHGTHVAGIAGARHDNNIGIEGVMGRSVQLMALKSQDEEGGGLLADVVNAVRWGTDHGAEVLNLSLSSRLESPALKEAIEYALSRGVVVTVASGNDGEEISASNIITPAIFGPELQGMLSVGSIDQAGLSRSLFSNYGAAYVEMAAAGEEGINGVLSTVPANKYGRTEGTSMASPQVAGAAAMAVGFLKTHGVSYTPAGIEQILQRASTSHANLSTSFSNGQVLNIKKLGDYLLNSTVVTSSGGFDEGP